MDTAIGREGDGEAGREGGGREAGRGERGGDLKRRRVGKRSELENS